MRNLKSYIPNPRQKVKETNHFYNYINCDLLQQSSYYSSPQQQYPNPIQDICSFVKHNMFQNFLIKLTYRRISSGFQNIKLLDFDKSSILDIQQPQKSKSQSQMIAMTAHNLVLVVDKVLLIKIQNKLSDAFLRIKLIKKKKVKKINNVKLQSKVAANILCLLFQKRLMNGLTKMITHFNVPQKVKSRFQSMQNIEQSISKYKTEITRLQNVAYNTKTINFSAPNHFKTSNHYESQNQNNQIYISKQSSRPHRRPSSHIISQFQNYLTDVSNLNFKKNKNSYY